MFHDIEQLNPNTAEKYRQVIEKSKYFVDIQLWPLLQKLNPTVWLENFRDDELEHATYLLDAFLYYSNDLIEAMFRAAFQGLGKFALDLDNVSVDHLASWMNFVDNILITHVTKEVPHSTESGYIFERMARQVLNLPTSQFKSGDALFQTLQGTRSHNVVFVDDFVGSGEQFLTTWRRPQPITQGQSTTFQNLALTRRHRFFYCPIICTEFAYNRLTQNVPAVIVCPAHVMSHRYSALESDSLVWPEHLRGSALAFLEQVSNRVGIIDTNGGVTDWRGFNKLGLTLAFEHSIPDATLPIFYWDKNGWKPLLRRV